MTDNVLDKLYVCRKVLNSKELIEWAKSVGFETCLEPNDMHVTVVYSKKEFDFTAQQPKQDKLRFSHPHNRKLVELGDKGAVVLMFNSPTLYNRWLEFITMGASWDYENYHSHITLTYKKPDNLDISTIEPYDGHIILGKEIFSKPDQEWTSSILEEAASFSASNEMIDHISKIADLKKEVVQKKLNTMSLGDYSALVLALDNKDNDYVNTVFDDVDLSENMDYRLNNEIKKIKTMVPTKNITTPTQQTTKTISSNAPQSKEKIIAADANKKIVTVQNDKKETKILSLNNQKEKDEISQLIKNSGLE